MIVSAKPKETFFLFEREGWISLQPPKWSIYLKFVQNLILEVVLNLLWHDLPAYKLLNLKMLNDERRTGTILKFFWKNNLLCRPTHPPSNLYTIREGFGFLNSVLCTHIIHIFRTHRKVYARLWKKKFFSSFEIVLFL